MATIPTKTTRGDSRPPAPVLVGEGALADFTAGKPEKFVPSGLGPLDDIILGAISGEMLMIAGAPSEGKTALGIQWLVGAAQKIGPTAILSLEMSRRALRNRLISGLTGIPMRMLRTKQWAGAKQKKSAMAAAEYLATLPLYVDDRSGLSPEKTYDTIVSWSKSGIVLGMVDYIQMIASKSDSRAVQVSEGVKAVKEGAKDGDIPIIGISSINRAATTRESKKPKLSDLKESGDLEYTGDTILMFHYPEDDFYEDVRVADIHVMKQRNGPTGVASVRFNKPATRFEEVA